MGTPPVVFNPFTGTFDFTGETGQSGFVKSVSGTNGVAVTTLLGNAVVSGINATDSQIGVAKFNVNEFTVSPSGSVTGKKINIIAGTNLTGGGLVALGGSVTLNAAAPPADLHVARFIVGDITKGANYATLSAAYAAAVTATGPQTVYMQDGTYNIGSQALAANVNIASFQSSAESPNVILNGKLTAAFAGSVALSGVCLQTNSDFCLSLTASTPTVELNGCFINALNNTAVNHAVGNIYFRGCKGDIAIPGIAFFTSASINGINFIDGFYYNTGGSTTASVASAVSGGVACYNCYIGFPITLSNGSALSALSVQFTAAIIINSTTSNNLIFNSLMSGGAASSVSIGAGATAKLFVCTVDSINVNAITGLGTLIYGGLSFSNTSILINPTLTKVPQPFGADQGGTGLTSPSTAGNVLTSTGTAWTSTAPVARNIRSITTPGAYPYLTLSTDDIIKIDTSAARTINLVAAPATGLTYQFKDNTGSAGANNITIVPNAGNIDGAGSYVISSNYAAIQLTYNGTQWNIL